MDAFNETLRSWQTFYFTAGAAAATLTGLMFVAISLGLPLISNVTDEMKAFASPSIFHFVSVLLLAFALLVPSYTPTSFALVLLVGGIPGLVMSTRYVRKLFRVAMLHQDFNPDDWLFQIILPSAGYVLIVLAALGFLLGQETLAFAGLCLATLSLLVCGIINTWAMVVWVVEQKR